MAKPVQCGQIVWAEMADANGIRKLRPAVVVSTTERINLTGAVEVVAVTSRLDRPLPADHVLLPWHPQGHPRTGLNRKSAAVCGWIGRILPIDVQDVAGLVPGPVLAEILSRIAATQPSSLPATPEPATEKPRDPPTP
jgi:mRNA-degrading endonuclease toxin of MazEF toxin-antitoxin module